MSEAPKFIERIRLPVEEEVWGMFVGALPQGFVPGSILFVGDDGEGTLAELAAKTYPGIHISIVDRRPIIIEWLTPKATKRGWSTFAGDIRDPDTIADIVKKTLGGADAVFMKHGVHLKHPRNQENFVASLFRLSRQDGFVGWSVPTIFVGSLVRPQEAFIDKTISHDIRWSTVYVGTNTTERQQRALQVSGAL